MTIYIVNDHEKKEKEEMQAMNWHYEKKYN
jgi:hypothetical protein